MARALFDFLDNTIRHFERTHPVFRFDQDGNAETEFHGILRFSQGHV